MRLPIFIIKGMEKRTEDILEAAIREFIELGEPISSGWLNRNYDFGIRSAMIRSELGELTELGFLEQPHHSAGRVPTDKGYEFFAERALGKEAASANRELVHFFMEGAWKNFLDKFSQELGILGIAHCAGEMHKDGLDTLFAHLEWDTKPEVTRVIQDIEHIDEQIARAEHMLGKTNDILEIFIGEKSPVTKSDKLSVFVADYHFPEGKTFIFAVGPKRMNYEKTTKILKGLKHATKQNGRK